jgi:PAS domain-containing protein
MISGIGSAPVAVDEFSEMIGLLYDASLDPQQWQPALMRIRDLFSANYATLILRPPSAEDLGLLIVASETTVEYYFPDYLASPFTGMPCDEVVTVEDILSISEWRHHAYYQTWCAPHHVFHVLAVDIRTPDHAVFPFRITRAEAGAHFTQEDRERLKQLLPHLRRALHFSTQLDRSESLRALYVQALGLLAVAAITFDKAGRILQMNSTAEQLIKAGDGLKLSGGYLEAHYPADNRILQAAIRKSVARLDTASRRSTRPFR